MSYRPEPPSHENEVIELVNHSNGVQGLPVSLITAHAPKREGVPFADREDVRLLGTTVEPRLVVHAGEEDYSYLLVVDHDTPL